MYPGEHAAQNPDKPAVIMAGSRTQLTYGKLEQQSCRLAQYLHAARLRRGDHIALLTDNTPTAFEVYWAAIRSGLYITTVNRHLSATEVEYIVRDSEAKAVIVAARLGSLVAEIGSSLTDIQVRLVFGGPVSGFESYEDALRASSSEPLSDQPRGTDCCTRREQQGGRRESNPRFPLIRSTSPAISTPLRSSRCTDSTRTPSTSPQHPFTTLRH